MMLCRPAQTSDLEDIYQLAKQAGVGLTTLPADKKLLEEKITRSIQSFAKQVTTPENEYYFFVLSDTVKNKVVGTSGIEATVGWDWPFFTYRISSMVRVSQKLNIQKQYQVLHLVNDYQGYSEVCTLYLSPEYRQHNNGAFLSKVRFLFMAQFQQRFTEKVIAEMRGYTDSNDVSPFWRSLGVHFFKIDFEEADYLTAKANKQFISDLMPRHPIYVSLLTKQAQEAIGKTHSKTRSALKILKRENFIFNQQIDIFDGGPVVEAQLSLIKTLRESKVYYLDGVVKTIDSPQYIITNNQLDFKACVGPCTIIDENKIQLTTQHATSLALQSGDAVRISALHAM